MVSLSFIDKNLREGKMYVQYDKTNGFLYFGYLDYR